MKHLFIVALAILGIAFAGCQPTKVAEDTRDYAYEAYCDSVWNANPDYYLDVLMETDKYLSYIDEHPDWWAEINSK